jgi:hypothetical protein
MSETATPKKRRFWQFRLSTMIVLSLIAAALSAEMSLEEQIGSRPIHHSGQKRNYGTPFPTYRGIADGDLVIKDKFQVENYYRNLALNAFFWTGSVFTAYAVCAHLIAETYARYREGRRK